MLKGIWFFRDGPYRERRRKDHHTSGIAFLHGFHQVYLSTRFYICSQNSLCCGHGAKLSRGLTILDQRTRGFGRYRSAEPLLRTAAFRSVATAEFTPECRRRQPWAVLSPAELLAPHRSESCVQRLLVHFLGGGFLSPFH